MESSQRRLERELRRDMEWLANRGQPVIPSRECHTRQAVKWTNLGSVRKEPMMYGEHGRLPNEMPISMGRPVPHGVHLQKLQAAAGESPTKHHSSWRKSVSVPSLAADPETSAESEANTIGSRWPCSAPFERPRAEYKDAVESLVSRSCLVPASRAIGEGVPRGDVPRSRGGRSADSENRHKTPPAAAAEGGANYLNPFMNRFFDRRGNGGFYAGSVNAAPKITSLQSR
eukprot:TRINITY_DN68342_c0_g1_i1.p1 TRINITY_DN68342_c0_g1~~TRINITY_DN68342_c0_g1_i1.p1  ORF type:complete len:242 (-),score=31.02 TRINITY_DN68342_c0_g1_i1:86-772(-)